MGATSFVKVGAAAREPAALKTTASRRSRKVMALMCHSPFGAEAGVGANLEFGELFLGRIVHAASHGSEERGGETQRDADDAGVLQREQGGVLDEVVAVGAHDAGADDDERQR